MSDLKHNEEAAVCDRLGLSRSLARRIRDQAMKNGVDWSMDKGRVILSDSGISILTKKASVPVEAVQPLENPPAQHSQAISTDKKATVTRLFQKNHKILLATVGELKDQRVRVRDSALITIGMEITVRHVQADLWKYVGRLPRFRGRM